METTPDPREADAQSPPRDAVEPKSQVPMWREGLAWSVLSVGYQPSSRCSQLVGQIMYTHSRLLQVFEAEQAPAGPRPAGACSGCQRIQG
ncbi:hypothetical protein [Streptomyces avermitilis]|uniref:hypothetical protein n=1 Tax=Streptomyces avermitilis TaxID=33903 RepID=UPI00340829D7